MVGQAASQQSRQASQNGSQRQLLENCDGSPASSEAKHAHLRAFSRACSPGPQLPSVDAVGDTDGAGTGALCGICATGQRLRQVSPLLKHSSTLSGRCCSHAATGHSPAAGAEASGPTEATVADALCSVTGGSSPRTPSPPAVVMLHHSRQGGVGGSQWQQSWPAVALPAILSSTAAD